MMLQQERNNEVKSTFQSRKFYVSLRKFNMLSLISFTGQMIQSVFALSMMLVQMGHKECWKFLRAKQRALPTH